MKTPITIILTLVFAFVAIQSSSAQQQDGRKLKEIEARTLLSPGAFPKGVVIRVHADMFGSKSGREAAAEPKEDDAPVEKHFREVWEFTSGEVHRVVYEAGKKEGIYRRVESRPFDTKDIWMALTDGTPLEIAARKGKGVEVMFAGTDYVLGMRSIEVLRNGKPILDLCETCVGAGFPGTDAHAFAALYERLAMPARVLFTAKADGAK